MQGLCGAPGLVIARAVVRDAFSDARIAHVFSVLMLINGLAAVLAPLIGAGLLHLMPWRGLFWVLAGRQPSHAREMRKPGRRRS